MESAAAAAPMPPPGDAPRLTIDVVELNPHEPRPFVFTEPALCLRDSIRAVGLGSNHRVNIADPDAPCIVLGAIPPHHGSLAQLLDRRKAMVFNFEQLGSTSGLASPEYLRWLRQWLVLDYHSRNVDFLRGLNGPAQQVLELPVVPSPSLRFQPELPAQSSVDVLFFGSANERRDALLRQLQACGLSVETVAGAYAQELAPAIRRARLVLHVHFYETGLFPVARVLQPVACGVPIVCESSVFSSGCDWSASGILFAPYEGLVEACQRLLASETERQRRAERARNFAAGIDFATPFQQVLEALHQRLASPSPAAAALPPRPAAPPQPISAPQPAGPAQATPLPVQPSPGDSLTTEEIEAILEREAAGLPPEADRPAPPLKLAERQPGQGRYGLLVVVLLLAFSIYTIWQSMRR